MQPTHAMQRAYEKWFSPALNREMELLHFGWSGFPVVMFPTSMGRFFQYEDTGLVARLSDKLERGEMQLFCVDSIDGESWYNQESHPAERGPRHERYHAYLRDEVLAYVRTQSRRGDLGLFGCSFGGYHAANFAGREPHLVTKVVCFSGIFSVHRFTDGYWDGIEYANSPSEYLVDLEGDVLERVKRVQWIIATGEFDSLVEDNRRFDRILSAKGVPHHSEIWPGVSGHDWPFWIDAVERLL